MTTLAFSLGDHLGDHVVDAQLGCDPGRGLPVVAREHHREDALLIERLHRATGRLTRRVGHGDQRHRPAIQPHPDDGAPLAGEPTGICKEPVERDALSLQQAAVAGGDCHSYGGSGGTDAPAFDSMRGKLSVRDIASMSGTIWNHAPHLAEHFSEEKIPFPSFGAGEMADLLAYLHRGPPTTP